MTIISILREATSRWLGKQLVRTSQLVKAEAGVKTTRNNLLGSLGIAAEARRCRHGDRLTLGQRRKKAGEAIPNNSPNLRAWYNLEG